MLRPEDLAATVEVQAAVYPAFLLEAEPAFLSRLKLAASYCLAAHHDGALVGYLLAHGWTRQSPPNIGTLLADGVPSEVLYIHDLAVSPAARGLRAGQKLLSHAFARAAQDGLSTAELIAVEGAADYWARLGFDAPIMPPEFLDKLATYGSSARWMTRQIAVHS